MADDHTADYLRSLAPPLGTDASLTYISKRRLLQAADRIKADARRIAELVTERDRWWANAEQQKDRAHKAEAERDDALAEAARLREALSNLLDCVEEGSFSSHEACGSVPAARAALADTEEAKR